MTESEVLGVAEARARLDAAGQAAEHAAEELTRIKTALQAGDTTISPDDYAEAVRAVEYTRLVRDGAEAVLAGAEERARLEAAERREREQRAAVRASAEAVLAAAEAAAALLPLLPERCQVPTLWDQQTEALRTQLQRFAGTGGIYQDSPQSAAAMARRELQALGAPE